MKTLFLVVAAAASVCAYAVPEIEEENRPSTTLVTLDLDKLDHIKESLVAELAAKVEEIDLSSVAGINTELIAGGKWAERMKKVPWGEVIDKVYEGIKKLMEPKKKKDE